MNISRVLALIACATLATGGVARADAWVYAKRLMIITSSGANTCDQTWDHFRCKTDYGRQNQLNFEYSFEYAPQRFEERRCVVILFNRGSIWKGDVWRAEAQSNTEGTCIVHQKTANVFDVSRPQGQ
jgi:hypothetical protein